MTTHHRQHLIIRDGHAEHGWSAEGGSTLSVGSVGTWSVARLLTWGHGRQMDRTGSVMADLRYGDTQDTLFNRSSEKLRSAHTRRARVP